MPDIPNIPTIFDQFGNRYHPFSMEVVTSDEYAAMLAAGTLNTSAFYNVDGTLKYYNGSAWVDVGGGGAETSYDVVTVTSDTPAIRSAPCTVAGFVCTASSSGNITLYANSANSGTVIFTGAVVAGTIYTLPAPYESFLGLSFDLVSGTCSINISVK